MRRCTPLVALALAGIFALALFGCAPRSSAESHSPKTIRWWHINSDLPSQKVFDEIAREFEASHPWVTVKVVVLDNMEYKPKLKLELAAKDPPDIFHSWGGGNMVELAKQGYLRDISSWVNGEHWKSRISPVALGMYSYDGKVYGFPQDLGMVGFWYNSELLSKAGFSAFPADWDGFLQMCASLKKAGIVPVSLGLADRWTAMYYWAYFALRLGGPGVFDDILGGKRSFEDPALIGAGRLMQDFYGRALLQRTAIGDDFMAQSRYMGDGKCAVQLMGQWALALQAQAAEQKDKLERYMRFAPFPAVRGGKGGAQDVMGGGNGFVIGKNAPDEAVELLEYWTRAENLQRYFDVFPAVPTVDEVKIANPALLQVKSFLRGMASYCLYPDQMFPQEINDLIDGTTARIMIGELTPERGCAIIDEAWKKAQAASP